MGTSSELPPRVAVQLLTALVQAVADELETEVLFIKGVIAHAQELRDREYGSDVDVIVDPEKLGQFVDAFQARGWRARFTPEDRIRVVPSHAVSLVHSDWPCDLDLHYFFVGTFANPDESFRVLSAEAGSCVVAGQSVSVPSRDAHRLLLALNTVRDTGSHSAEQDAARLGRYFIEHPESWEDVQLLAARTRSLSVLRVFASRAGLTLPPHDLTETEIRQLEYIINFQSGGFGVFRYRMMDSNTTIREKARVLGYSLFKPSSVLALENPGFEGGMRATLMFNLNRWRKGLDQLKDRGHERLSSRGQPALEKGSPFRPQKQVGQLEYAVLKEADGGTILENSPSTRQVQNSVSVNRTILSAQTPLYPAAIAKVLAESFLYLLSLDREFMTENSSLTPSVFRLDTSGQAILDLFAGAPITTSEIADRIAGETAGDKDSIEKHVLDFVGQMAHGGILGFSRSAESVGSSLS